MKRLHRTVLLLFFSIISSVVLANDCCRTECAPDNSCDCEITSRSYLAVRPLFQSASPEMISGFRSDRLHAKEDGWHGAAQAVVFGSKSANDRDLARYFFPFCKTELVVEEFFTSTSSGTSTAATLPTSSEPLDLLANHFNIFTNNHDFKSKISIRPQQSVVGVGFQGRKAFCMNEEKGRGFYTSFSFPVQRVKNNLKLQEDIIRDGGGANTTRDRGTAQGNMIDALTQDSWDFGKIKKGSMSKTGVADIEFKVGYEWIQEDPFHLESYLGILIPTGNKPNSKFLFEPIVGHGRHWGIMFGNSLGIQIWSDEAKDRSLRVEYASHSQYLFRNTQCRSLDLFCKPWSRYIEVYRNEDEANTASTLASQLAVDFATAGINVLTIPLKVRPGFSHNMTTAAVFTTNGWQFEGGYNLYCRQSECLKLSCPWQEGPAIKYANGAGKTNPVRDITGNARLENIVVNSTPGTGNRVALGDYKYNFIKESDLDLISASSPAVLSHTVYVALGYRWDDYDYPTFVNAGGSYEFNKGNNAGIERWTIWGKIGFSF